MDGSVLMNRDLVDRLEQKFERAINDRITPLVQRIATLEDEIEHLKARISGDGGHKRPSTGRSDEEVSNDATFGQSTGLSKSHDDDLANETGDMDEEEEQGADAEFVNNSQLLNVGNKKPRLKYGISTCKAKKAFDAQSFCDVADTLMSCERIVFIVGAGISASCGISTFRGEGGLYDKIDSDRKLKKQLGITKKKADGSFFTKKNFKKDPWNFMWKWSTRHYDDSLRPGPTHNFLAWLESKNKLLRVYTTNSDGLELAAGVSAELVIHAHGTMARGYCMECGKEGDIITTVIQKEEIAKFLKKDKVPMCRHFDRNGKLIDGPEPKGRGAKRCTGESSVFIIRFYSWREISNP